MNSNPLNPLSPLAYTLRHKRRALMLAGLLALAVTGLYLLAGLMQASFVRPIYELNRYLTKFSLVQSDAANALDPAIVGHIRAHPDVAQVLPQNNVRIATQTPMGIYVFIRLIGLQEAHVADVLAHSDLTLVEGQLPQSRTPGVALSQEVAAALDLEIGDTFDWTEDDVALGAIVSPLEVVGLLSGDVRLGVVSYEYLEEHERYRDVASFGVLVMAHPGGEAAVEDLLDQSIDRSRIEIYTHRLLTQELAGLWMGLLAMLLPIVLAVTIAVTVVVGAANRLAFLRRLPEFGTLHAIGHGKRQLVRRLTLETAGLALVGWVTGFLISLGGMAILNAVVYAPRGFAFAPIQEAALLAMAPLPAAVIGSTLLTAKRVLGRMDAVAIVERGELSLEGTQRRHGRAQSLPRPLASATFYWRHRGQAAVLIGSMALMIVGAVLLVFVATAFIDVAEQPALTPLESMSTLSPRGLPLEATVIAQVRAHPGVERAIPAYAFAPLEIAIPPTMTPWPASAYGVAAEDMTYLVDLYDLELAEGHLPRPNTNEIVISWAIAQNQDIQVGDVIGDRARSIISSVGAVTPPSELEVSGIFASSEERWISFMSLEFVEDYRDRWRGDLSLIVVPKAGQRATLDTWLEDEIAGERITVNTYGRWQAWFQGVKSMAMFTFSLMESVVAVVAALALAGLYTIFITQRQAELGVLNALGLSRRQLVWRVVRESLCTTGAAWLLGALGCCVALLCLHQTLYAPVGLSFRVFDPTPWSYTLPIPLTVLAASAATTAWTLSRLDPVAVIERR